VELLGEFHVKAVRRRRYIYQKRALIAREFVVCQDTGGNGVDDHVVARLSDVFQINRRYPVGDGLGLPEVIPHEREDMGVERPQPPAQIPAAHTVAYDQRPAPGERVVRVRDDVGDDALRGADMGNL